MKGDLLLSQATTSLISALGGLAMALFATRSAYPYVQMTIEAGISKPLI